MLRFKHLALEACAAAAGAGCVVALIWVGPRGVAIALALCAAIPTGLLVIRAVNRRRPSVAGRATAVMVALIYLVPVNWISTGFVRFGLALDVVFLAAVIAAAAPVKQTPWAHIAFPLALSAMVVAAVLSFVFAGGSA